MRRENIPLLEHRDERGAVIAEGNAGLSGLERVIEKVGGDLHSQYLLSFQPDSPKVRDYHEITVHVRRAGVVVRARPGYWAE